MEVPQEIISRYLARRERELGECLVYLDKRNFPDLEKVGHQLKGNGVTFGYPELSRLGVELEEAARLHDHEASLKVLREFSGWVRSHRH